MACPSCDAMAGPSSDAVVVPSCDAMADLSCALMVIHRTLNIMCRYGGSVI